MLINYAEIKNYLQQTHLISNSMQL